MRSLLQCLGVRVHGVQEHGKRGLLLLLAPLFPLLPTRLKTRAKSWHVDRSPFQLREANQQVSRQIIVVLIHTGHQGLLYFLKRDLHNHKNHLFDWILCIYDLPKIHLLDWIMTTPLWAHTQPTPTGQRSTKTTPLWAPARPPSTGQWSTTTTPCEPTPDQPAPDHPPLDRGLGASMGEGVNRAVKGCEVTISRTFIGGHLGGGDQRIMCYL